MIAVPSDRQTFVHEFSGASLRYSIYCGVFGACAVLFAFLGWVPAGGGERDGVALLTVIGVSFLLFGLSAVGLKRVVSLSPETRRCAEFVSLFGFLVYRRSIDFEALRCIETRSTGFESSDKRLHQVGIRPSRGSVVWLRDFMADSGDLPEDAEKFIAGLTEITGLRKRDGA